MRMGQRGTVAKKPYSTGLDNYPDGRYATVFTHIQRTTLTLRQTLKLCGREHRRRAYFLAWTLGHQICESSKKDLNERQKLVLRLKWMAHGNVNSAQRQ